MNKYIEDTNSVKIRDNLNEHGKSARKRKVQTELRVKEQGSSGSDGDGGHQVVQDYNIHRLFKKQVTDGRYYFGRLSVGDGKGHGKMSFFILEETTAILQIFDSLSQASPTGHFIISGSIVVIDLE